jgi:hypothetical protein
VRRRKCVFCLFVRVYVIYIYNMLCVQPNGCLYVNMPRVMVRVGVGTPPFVCCCA